MTEPIRILQVFALMNRGGAETMIMNLYRNIDRSKIQFDFVVHTNKKSTFDDEIKELGGKIFRVPAYVGKNHMTYKKSWEIFFENHPEYKIVHGHVRSTASIYLRLAKKFGVLTIAHSHNTSSGNGYSSLFKNILQFPIRYIADYFFACSYPAGTWLFGEKKCQNDNFFLINNAINTKKFVFNEDIRAIKRKELNINENFLIGHVGRFHVQKNHDYLIDIFKAVQKKNKNTILLLVGEGNLRKEIEEKVKDLGLQEKVIFTGVRSDTPELLQAMDVFLFPSLYEGLPVTLVEAQGAGLHSVVSNTISSEVNLITNLMEFVSLKESEEFWAEKILKYANGYKRISTFEEIKSKGYDIETTSKWLENFYLSNWK